MTVAENIAFGLQMKKVSKDEIKQRVDEALYQSQVAMLQDAQRRNPALRVFTLDYWDPSDAEGLREIYHRQRAQGFSPYVATIALDEVIVEPAL